jgi:hypothetical protein
MRKTEKTQSLTPLIQRQRGAEGIVKILKCPGNLEKNVNLRKPWTVVLIKLGGKRYAKYNISSWFNYSTTKNNFRGNPRPSCTGT